MVGRLAQQTAPSLAIGSHLKINAVDWRIVGVFESSGDAHESELLADGPTLMAGIGRNEYSSATVQLSSAENFESFRSAAAAIRGANLKAERESDYYEGQSETMSQLAFIITYVVGTIMALGATCGALNMTYAAVDARTREVATLRAIGFGAVPIMVSVVAESTLLAFVGACVGALLAWVVGDGNTFAAAQYLGPGASANHLTLRLDVCSANLSGSHPDRRSVPGCGACATARKSRRPKLALRPSCASAMRTVANDGNRWLAAGGCLGRLRSRWPMGGGRYRRRRTRQSGIDPGGDEQRTAPSGTRGSHIAVRRRQCAPGHAAPRCRAFPVQAVCGSRLGASRQPDRL